MESANIYNKPESLGDCQYIYDSYNDFIFSPDRSVIFKMFTRFRLYEKIRHLHGDIVECGVFKGAGVALWLKMINMDSPHGIRKVIGFDFFDPSFVETLNTHDKSAMEQVFIRCQDLDDDEISLPGVTNKLYNAGFKSENFDLIKGDLSKTCPEYLKSRPGLRIALLYLDVDLEEPTYEALNQMWDKMVIGGIVVFDEYAYHTWSESNAVDRFISEKNCELHKLDVKSPTAYIVKKK